MKESLHNKNLDTNNEQHEDAKEVIDSLQRAIKDGASLVTRIAETTKDDREIRPLDLEFEKYLDSLKGALMSARPLHTRLALTYAADIVDTKDLEGAHALIAQLEKNSAHLKEWLPPSSRSVH